MPANLDNINSNIADTKYKNKIWKDPPKYNCFIGTVAIHSKKNLEQLLEYKQI